MKKQWINRGNFFSVALASFVLFSALPPAQAQDEPKVFVAFWFDTEDYILPEADDAAMRLAEMFTQRGVQATFKIVGEKARVLEERGREDVIAALSRNDIAYHSTFHSVHPTPSEYSRDLGWSEGVAEFIRREGPGLEILRRVFGVNASCYGQPGSSWTPQSYAALRQWNIPLYLDVTDQVGLDQRPFWYGGVLNVLELGDCVMRTGWSNEEVKEACEKFDRVHERLIGGKGGIVSIYYHPCEFVHQQFWDGVNFSKGANPPRSEWKRPLMKSKEESEQAFHAFETFLDHIVKHPNVQLVTARQIPSLYPDRAYSHSLTREDLSAIARSFQQKISFVSLNSEFKGIGETKPTSIQRAISAAEGLYALAWYLSHWEKSGPETIPLQFAFGPASNAEEYIKDGSFRWERIKEAAGDYLQFLEKNKQMPSVAWVDGKPARPQDFAATLAWTVEQLLTNREPPKSVTWLSGKMEAQKYVADDDPKLWGWVIFPPGFHAPRLMEIAKLQAWTLKPAILRQ